MGSKKVTTQAVLKAFAEIANLYIHGEFLDPISVHI